jgi:hypothetical protein
MEQAAKDFAGIVKDVAAAYIGFMISESLQPVLTEALTSMLDDAKSSSGLVKEKPLEMKDKLPSEAKDVAEPGLFNMYVEGLDYIGRGSWSWFASYPMYAVRVDKDSNGKLFILGKQYKVRYQQLKTAIAKRKKEIDETKEKDAKPITDMPKEPIYGYVCCCIEKHDSESENSSLMRNYMKEFVANHKHSEALATHFRLGKDWARQERSFAIFKLAYGSVKEQFQRKFGGSWWKEPLSPYDEGEAVTILLQNFAAREVTPKLYDLVPNVPVFGWRLRYNMDLAVDQAIEVAMAGWGPVQDGVNTAVAQVQKLIDEGAAKLVEQLKPLLAKVLAIVVDKLGKDKKEEKEEEKKGPQVGDVVGTWDFGRTDLGGKFSNTLKEKGAKDAWFDLNGGLKDAVNNAIEARLTSAAKSALGEGRASMEIVKIILEAVAQQIGKVLRQYTTITPLAKAVEPIAAIVGELEAKLGEKKGDKDAQLKLVLEYSGKWWQELGNGGLAMYMAFVKLKDAINSDMSGVCEDGVKPMQDYADNLFQIQMRVLNAVRVVFTNKLVTAVNAGQDGSAAVRQAFRDASFDHIGLLVSESWVQFTSAIMASTLAQVLDKFDRDIWPSIEQPLLLLEELIPDPLKQAGLKIVPLARTIIVMLITKGVTWALTKLTLACEKGLFTQ